MTSTLAERQDELLNLVGVFAGLAFWLWMAWLWGWW